MSISSIESNIFLKKFINQEGKVDYTNLHKSALINEKIKEIETIDLDSFSSKDEELAFWLNTYNLLVLKGVLKKLAKNQSWKGTTTIFSRFRFFALQKFTVGNKRISLYSIENKILRSKFKDPRIHFVLNCASTSCPFLPSLLFEEETLDFVLDKFTENFINDNNNVSINEKNNSITLNKIFKWYKSDFNNQDGILQFIKKYRKDFPQLLNPTIFYSQYNWALNKQ